jgi:hypothetical protein
MTLFFFPHRKNPLNPRLFVKFRPFHSVRKAAQLARELLCGKCWQPIATKACFQSEINEQNPK